MDGYRTFLYNVAEELDKQDLAALKFLCLDHIPLKKQGLIEDAVSLFKILEEKGLLEEDDLSFLKELLYHTNRIDLLINHLNTNKMEVQHQILTKSQVSPYRVLLFNLSEDVAKFELKNIKFILSYKIPKCKLEDDMTLIDIFIEMEKRGLLGEENLDDLKAVCDVIDKNLLKKIKDFESSRVQRSTERVPVEIQDVEEMSDLQATSKDSPGEKIQDKAYKMSSKPRGYCLIISNFDFQRARMGRLENQNLKDRKGTDVDEAVLQSTFKELHFEIVILQDRTAEQIHQDLQNFQEKNHEDKDCFVCCLLSHGDRGTIYGIDGQEVAIKDLTSYFSSSKCPSLAGKPKVFFIQACQGKAIQSGITLDTDSEQQRESLETDTLLQSEVIPDEADFLLGMATVENHISYRHPIQGTWYIQSLCRNLKERCPRGEDILDILTEVNYEVSKNIDWKNKGTQMPQPKYTLRKKLFFPIK
ncbi:caspase-8 [Dromiciops gliroides]|uniref:caspase-8 n=1 Tax=Dromiciops gliroides TaxID=33562 RepID=UPI001CC44F51|nr:caspase-8 [Dromiciops gliroides]XP_043854684.1 caspase-8 [Dromiciops gliroides]XP_043854685.1 caspase-8 [Dromiciops gliroides]XP_043854686.1 caspase-8 [Dromiciops gliroides]XP_043854687.1 caspase-8 [Dromiciops gliroides]